MPNSISRLNLDDFEVPPLPKRLERELEKHNIEDRIKEALYRRILQLVNDELVIREEEYKQLYYPTTGKTFQ